MDAASARPEHWLADARRARALAHEGRVEAAHRLTAALRSGAPLTRHPAALVSVMIAEGVCAGASGDWHGAADRLRRAGASARFLGDGRLQALASAWLGAATLNRGDFDEAATLCAQALRAHAPPEPEVGFRAASLLGFLHEIAGRREAAMRWFEAARRHALRAGSQAQLAATLHAMGAARVGSHLVQRVAGAVDAAAVERDLMMLRSSAAYDAGCGIVNQRRLHDLLAAQLHNTLGDIEAALAALDRFFEADGPVSAVDDLRARLERLLARARLRPAAVDLAELEAVAGRLGELTDADDAAVADHVLAAACAAAGLAARAAAHDDLARAHLGRRRALQDAVALHLDSLGLPDADDL